MLPRILKLTHCNRFLFHRVASFIPRVALRLPRAMISRPYRALALTRNQTMSYFIISQAQTIREKAFQNSDCISAYLPEADIIEASAFEDCQNLRAVFLPNVLSIKSCAFQGCINLRNTCPNTRPFLDRMSTVPPSTLVSLIEPESPFLSGICLPNATFIERDAFGNCKNLETIVLPNVTSIESNVFHNCDNLKSIFLPKVGHIPAYTFYNCRNLKSIFLPNTTEIESGAFSGCVFLTKIDLPSVVKIDANAFDNCLNLSELILSSPNTIDITPDDSFRDHIAP